MRKEKKLMLQTYIIILIIQIILKCVYIQKL